jgi:SOS-response transcriptional repressor LexA
MKKGKDISHSNVGLDEQLAKVASPHAFALIIKDNSMTPLFNLGDVIIIDPAIQPSPGEFVAARTGNHDTIVFRKYRPISPHDTNSFRGFELIALNEDWGKITITDKDQAEIIGTLLEHRCRRRMTFKTPKVPDNSGE